jgi:acetyl esterase/lipase
MCGPGCACGLYVALYRDFSARSICLATDLYLIRPPPGAIHTAVPANKIVFAGDSAGGGLCLTALTILRDMGLPMPAGSVLISPWVDMTHTFPSVMQNVDSVGPLYPMMLSSLKDLFSTTIGYYPSSWFYGEAIHPLACRAC